MLLLKIGQNALTTLLHSADEMYLYMIYFVLIGKKLKLEIFKTKLKHLF